jgi:hypothetical protein
VWTYVFNFLDYCYGLNVPKIHVLKLNRQCDNIEKIRTLGGDLIMRAELLCVGLRPLTQCSAPYCSSALLPLEDTTFVPSALWGHSNKASSVKQRTALTTHQMLELCWILNFLTSRIMRTPVLFFTHYLVILLE